VQQTEGYRHRFENQILNDGRPDFTTVRDNFYGWFNGPKPSFQDSLQRACDVNFVPGCVYRSLVQEINYPGRQTSYSHQASAGVQRQFGTDTSLEVNYVFTGGRREETAQQVNMTYNPATGANYPFTNIGTRAFPQWGAVDFELLEGWSNYNAADFTFTKRFSHRWQGSATYTLSQFKDADPNRDQWYIGSDGLVARPALHLPLRNLGHQIAEAIHALAVEGGEDELALLHVGAFVEQNHRVLADQWLEHASPLARVKDVGRRHEHLLHLIGVGDDHEGWRGWEANREALAVPGAAALQVGERTRPQPDALDQAWVGRPGR